MIKGVTHAHLGPIWYYSEASEVPYSPNQFLHWYFFAASYSKTALEQIDNKGKQKVWMKPTCVTDNTVFILGHRSSKTDEN